MNRNRWLATLLAAVVSVVALVVSPPAASVRAEVLPTLRQHTAAVQRDTLPTSPPSPPRSLPSPTPSQLPPIVVMAVGDSLTVGHGPEPGSVTPSYRPELSRLMNRTGQPHTWVVAAEGGTKCSWWAARINDLITLHRPHIIFLNCGTNDVPGDPTEANYRTILATAQARGVQVVASLIGRPDMESPTNTIRPWIEDWMDDTNDAIRRALVSFPGVPVANMLRVPANPEWLQPDGIHLTARSEAAWGQLFYQAARAIRPAWRAIVEMCGLSGHDRDDPWPTPGLAYTVCWF